MNFRNLKNQQLITFPLYGLKQFKKVIFLFLIFCFAFSLQQTEAQIFKKLGKKIEQKIEQRVDRKTDKAIDKALDKTELEAGKALESNPDSKKPEDKNVSKSVETSTVGKTVSTPTTANIADGVIMISSDCSDFIWFKKGAHMKFENLNGKGNSISKSEMTITDVNRKGGATIADANFKDSEKNEFNMQYKCADGKLYVDFSSALKEAMAKSGGGKQAQGAMKNVEMGFSDGFMTFPSNMYPGQNLDDAVFTMKTNSANMTMEVTSTLTDRKVTAKEKITTPAGTFDCLKIVGTRKTTMNVLGRNQNMGKPTQEFIWMAPGIGNIKSEVYNDKGKLESKTHLIEFKM
ncbi:MAG: hypothetical protein ABI297_06360 [Ginsengibacter sp.]